MLQMQVQTTVFSSVEPLGEGGWRVCGFLPALFSPGPGNQVPLPFLPGTARGRGSGVNWHLRQSGQEVAA